MSERSASTGQAPPVPAWLIAVAMVASLAMFAAILLIPAGRLDWSAAWVYLGIFTAFMIANLVYLQRQNPELIERRSRIGKGTKQWDMVWAVFFAPLFLAVYVVAGLDAGRYGWSSMPGWLWLVGLALEGVDHIAMERRKHHDGSLGSRRESPRLRVFRQ